jgi:hypothetical protein
MAAKIELSRNFFFDIVWELSVSISQLQSLEMLVQVSLSTNSVSVLLSPHGEDMAIELI